MRTFFFALLLLAYSKLNAQEVERVPFVLRHAYFAIAGETNINNFSCRLVLQNLSDTLAISGNWKGLSLDTKGLDFQLPTNEFDCGMKMMTKDFQKLLQSEKYPYIGLSIDMLHLNDDYNLDSLYNVGSNAIIQIASQTQIENIQNGYLRNYEGQFILGGSHKIKMTQYNIEPPSKFFGAVKAKEELYIEFEVIFEPVKPN